MNTSYGFRFPVDIDPKTGAIAGTDFETDIKQSILILLGTRIGERIGRAGYGSGLMRFTFENISYGLIKEICSEITQTISRWEDRVENIGVNAVTASEGHLAFVVSYDVSQTGIRDEVRYELSIG